MKWLDDLDRDMNEVYSRVLTASPGLEKDCDWEEFERDLVKLTEFLRIRHQAKHLAARAELYNPTFGPFRVTLKEEDLDAVRRKVKAFR